MHGAAVMIAARAGLHPFTRKLHPQHSITVFA